MSVDTPVETHLANADFYCTKNEAAAALGEIGDAVSVLTEEGSVIFNKISADEFETPLFQFVRRITTVFIPDVGEISAFVSDKLPHITSAPKDIVEFTRNLFTTDEPYEEEPTISKIEYLVSLLTGQQSMRDAIFSDDGLYHSAAGTFSPYLIGFFSITGDDFSSAEEKADSLMYGPAKRLAELFYSLLTSSLTAGLLLLFIRRLIPVFRPSKTATAVDAALLTAANLPLIIQGLRAVAKELAELRRIISVPKRNT